MNPVKAIVEFFMRGARWLKKCLTGVMRRISVNQIPDGRLDDANSQARFSRAWYASLYADLGDGITCYRPMNEPNYGGGVLPGCVCCKPNTLLHLLPREEKMFEESVNDRDFRLIDHPRFQGRKSLVCSKLGLCGGNKPFVCRTHPVYFVDGLMLYEESLCRLGSVGFIQRHAAAVEHIRAVVHAKELGDTLLGYGRTARVDGGLVHIDYER